MKHFLLTLSLLPLVASIEVSAHDIAVVNEQGKTIYYVWTNNNTELAVSYKGSNYLSKAYSGDLIIPESVIYNANTYNVTSISNHAFYGCNELNSITIPNSVTSIADYAFDGCRALTSLIIPNSVSSISSGAFRYCTGLLSVFIPNSVTNIGDNAFQGCSSLLSIIIPNSVATIGAGTFQDCSGLLSVIISNSVTSIGKYAFKGCTGMTSVTIPNSVTSIDSYAFEDCSSLTSVHISDIAAWCNISFYDNLSNPLYNAHHLYMNGTEVKDLVIPNGVTSIGSYAFSGCSDLTSIIIPSNVTYIGSYAFSDCSGLTSLTIPASVTDISNFAFSNCNGLTAVTVLCSPQKVGKGIFWNCSNIQEFVFDCETVTPLLGTTSESNFYPNTYVNKITLTERVSSIGFGAFFGCKGLTSITIPNSVTLIAGKAFQSCTNLTSIDIPNNVTFTGGFLFAYCTNLTSINIPNSVTNIGDCTFEGCNNLTSITIPPKVSSIGNHAFRDCTSLTSLEVQCYPNIVGTDAFSGCTNLKEITFDCEKVSSLFNMFTSLEKVILKESTTTIDYGAFVNSNELTNITIFADIPPTMYNSTFPNYDIPLFVPKNSISLYQKTTPWNNFTNIRTLSGEQFEICATPTINYKDGKLSFACETEGVTFCYSFSTNTIDTNNPNEVKLPQSHIVNVYAKKVGYLDSEIVTKEINTLKGDVNEDGVVSITDAVSVVNIILNGGE